MRIIDSIFLFFLSLPIFSVFLDMSYPFFGGKCIVRTWVWAMDYELWSYELWLCIFLLNFNEIIIVYMGSLKKNFCFFSGWANILMVSVVRRIYLFKIILIENVVFLFNLNKNKNYWNLFSLIVVLDESFLYFRHHLVSGTFFFLKQAFWLLLLLHFSCTRHTNQGKC